MDPGDLIAVDIDGEAPGTFQLFDTANAQGHFAPNLNVGNEGPWSASSSSMLTLTEPLITLEDVEIDWQHFDNNGNFQAGGNFAVNWTVTVTGSVSGLLDSETVTTPTATSGIETITFSSPLVLSDSEIYEVTILAEGLGGGGNNTGIDALTIHGATEPSANSTTGADVLIGASNTVDTTITDVDTATWSLTQSASQATSGVDEGNTAIHLLALDGTLQAGETAGVDLAISFPGGNPAEGADFVELFLTDVADAIAVYNGGGNSGTYSLTGNTLFYTHGGTESTVTDLNIQLPTFNDAVVEGDEDYTLTISTPAGTPSQTDVIILSTGFTNRMVTDDTASNIGWTVNGVDDPGDLTAVDINSAAPGTFGLFDTTAAQGHFAPNLNVANEGPWSTSASMVLDLTAPQIDLEEVVIDWQHFSNSGNFQGAGRVVDWTVTVTGSLSGELGSETGTTPSATSGIETITFASPLTLTSVETYTVTILAEGSGPGNNTGLDALTFNGDIVAPLTTTGADVAVDATDFTTTTTINDDDSLTVEFDQATGMDAENIGGDLPQLLVTGEIEAGHSVDIDVTVSGGTATGSDFTAPTTLTLLGGTYTAASPQAIPSLAITPDGVVELDETIDLSINATPADVTVGTQGTTTYTIENDDSATISISNVSQTETDDPTTTFTFNVTMSAQVDTTVSATVDTMDGTAVVGGVAPSDDYDAISPSGTVSFTAGDQMEEIEVTVNGDNFDEANETFSVILSSLSAGGREVTFVSGDPMEIGTGTIENDDATPVANPDSITVLEGGTTTQLDPTTINDSVLDDDTDADDVQANLTVTLVSGPSFAAVAGFTLNPDGTFSYTHDGSENHTDSFTYTVSDGSNTSLPATVTINVTPVNDKVVIDSPAQSGTITETVDAGASDPDPLDATGKITFDDVDLTDTHTASILAGASVTGGTATLSAAQEAALLDNLSLSAVAEDTPGDGEGEVVWTYAVPNSEIDFLAVGETVEATFTVEVDDLNSVDMEVATVGGITETATTVNFGQVFDTAPVVFVLLGEEDTGPAILRIDNVTTTGFDLAQLEADSTPSATTAATVTYFAIEKGVHTIGGVTFEVGTQTTTTQQHGAGSFTPGAEGYDAIALSGTFSAAPTVVAAVQTSNNPVTTLATAIRSGSVTTSGF